MLSFVVLGISIVECAFGPIRQYSSALKATQMPTNENRNRKRELVIKYTPLYYSNLMVKTPELMYKTKESSLSAKASSTSPPSSRTVQGITGASFKPPKERQAGRRGGSQRVRSQEGIRGASR